MFKKRVIYTWLPMAAMLAFMAVLFLTAPVFAQDEAPVEPAPEEVPVEEIHSEEAPVEEQALVELVATSEEGEMLPLASEEAAEVLASGDPWWKVGAITYRFLDLGQCAIQYPGDPYCMEDANPIQATITYIMINATAVPTDGKIYVEAGAYTNEDITIAGSNANLVKLKGLIGSLSPTTNLPDAILTNSTIMVGDMPGAFLLSGFNITADMPGQVVSFFDNSGAMTIQDMVVTNPNASVGAVGIRIVQTGAITLSRVDSSGNGENAAYLEHLSGTAGVTITNATFDDNNGTASSALTIITKGAIVLNNISASRNTTTGVTISTGKSLVIKNSNFHDNALDGVNVSGGSLGSISMENVYLNNNHEDGADITIEGSVSMKNIVAERNWRFGSKIDTCGDLVVCDMAGTGAVIITNATFQHNQQVSMLTAHLAGLSIYGKGTITLNNVMANNNGYYNGVGDYSMAGGAWLNNSQPISPATVSITQGTFDTNYWVGLKIITKGSVTLNTISAYGNAIAATPNSGIHGMEIDASFGNGSVTLTSTLGDSTFTQNDGYGIKITGKGNVSLSGKVKGISGISDNGLAANGLGISIENITGTGGVTVKNFTIERNQSTGLYLRTNGAITLDSVYANQNGLGTPSYGANIDNSTAASAKSVTIYASKFEQNTAGGLIIGTKGSVILNGISASNNSSVIGDPRGLEIQATSGSGSVSLLATKGTNMFNYNDGTGLYIMAKGKVSLVSLSAANNAYGDGVYVHTDMDVMIKHQYSYLNGSMGLVVSSVGNISVDDIQIASNGIISPSSGAFLTNSATGVIKKVLVTRSSFSNNTSVGLAIYSNGLITLNNVSATFNGGGSYGAELSTGTGGVSILSSYGANEFSNNQATGLRIMTSGPVTISKVTASSNQYHGIWVTDIGLGGVTITGGEFESNWASALYITVNGKVSISDVTSDSNGTNLGGSAIYLDNQASPTLETTVSMTRSQITNQPGIGISIYSKGVVTLNSVVSSQNNPGYGVYIDNTLSSKNAGISIFGSYGRNEFSDNSEMGLRLFSDGTITLQKVDVESNLSWTDGAYLNNTTGTGNISITDSNFIDNSNGNGITILTNGKVTWTGGSVENNGGMGASIDNHTSTTPMAVAISKVSFNYNDGDNLHVVANGQITLNKIISLETVTGSGGYGAYLDNAAYAGGVSVLSSYGANTFDQNDTNGLYVHTKGTVTLSKVSAAMNLGYGIRVDNDESGSTSSISYSSGTISQNGRDGVYMISAGNLTLSSIVAYDNGFGASTGIGIDLDNRTGTGYVTITKTKANQNDGYGLYVQSRGAITLNAVQSYDNNETSGYSGAQLDNHTGTGKVDVFSSMGTSSFHGNSQEGLGITSAGAVTVIGVSAYLNDIYGISVDNTNGTANISLSKCNVYNNLDMGVRLTSNGAVSISSSKIDSNDGNGMWINNTGDTSGTKGVTITSSFFNGTTSSGNGLSVASHGPVLLTSITASNNGWDGVYIDNLTGTITGTPSVKISGTNIFINNSWHGLSILSKGTITLENITSSYNLGYGMNLTSDTGSAINISNATLKQNNENGIYAISGGAINITGMVALFNGTAANYSGVYLSATGYDITIKNSAVNANGASGIVATTGATHTLYLTGVNYFGNDYFGGLVDPDLSFDGHLVLN